MINAITERVKRWIEESRQEVRPCVQITNLRDGTTTMIYRDGTRKIVHWKEECPGSVAREEIEWKSAVALANCPGDGEARQKIYEQWRQAVINEHPLNEEWRSAYAHQQYLNGVNSPMGAGELVEVAT